jgi:hypothetical protein
MFDPARWLLTPWASDLCSPYKEFECCSPNRDFENDTNKREFEVSLVPPKSLSLPSSGLMQ